jgi:hypothetical protein
MGRRWTEGGWIAPPAQLLGVAIFVVVVVEFRGIVVTAVIAVRIEGTVLLHGVAEVKVRIREKDPRGTYSLEGARRRGPAPGPINIFY